MKKKLFGLTLFLVLVFGVVYMADAVLAQDYGLGDTAKAAGIKKASLPTLVGNIIGTALSLISVVFFALMIYGGFKWMIDRGKEEHAKKALDTIIAAITGLIIVLASYAITDLVFDSVGGSGGSNTPTVQPASPDTLKNLPSDGGGAAPGVVTKDWCSDEAVSPSCIKGLALCSLNPDLPRYATKEECNISLLK